MDVKGEVKYIKCTKCA